MRRPVCCSCQVEYRPSKNGVIVVSHASFGPYTLTEADEFQCPGCGNKIITGFGDRPFLHHNDEGFSSQLAAAEENGLRRDNYETVEQAMLRSVK